MARFLSFMFWALVLAAVTAAWKYLMKATRAWDWTDWAVGIELMVAGVAVVIDSLVGEKSPYASVRLVVVIACVAAMFGATVTTRLHGYDANDHMTKKASFRLSLTGAALLIFIYLTNTHPEKAHAIWRSVFG